jgi:hypothetical protein
MSYIKKVSDFTSLAVTQEPLTEVTQQPLASQSQINTGIVNTTDEFDGQC